MAEGLQRSRLRRGCLVVLTAVMVAAVFSIDEGYAQGRNPWPSVEQDRSTGSVRDRRASRSATTRRVSGQRINANTVGIVSGNINGTYLRIAYDLSAVLDDGDDIRVLPIIGKGGAQNLRDVRYLKGVDLGITQSIILNTFRRTGELGNIDNKITYIAKLFNEEMHLVVRADSGITSISQLEGMKVNFSDVGSGTQLSTRDIFRRLGINPVEVNMGQGDAFEQLRRGTIAATVLIAGKPSGSMSRLKASEGFRMLPVPFSRPLQKEYLPAALTDRDYPNMIPPGERVDTIAVSAVLIAFNWPSDTDRYRRLERFVERFFPRLAEFQKPPRHPKWQETNLAAVVPGWKRFAPAEAWLKRNQPPLRNATGLQDQRQQFERFLATHPAAASGNAASPAQRDRLFRDFLRWNETHERR